MRILCLGGAGRICREAVLDIVQSGAFAEITIGDLNLDAARQVAQQAGGANVAVRRVNVLDQAETVALMRQHDLVMDGLPISLNDASAACIAQAGVHAINLNGMSREWEQDAALRRCGKTFVPGFGMTPGITNLMAMYAASQLDTVESVRCSHGAFRPIAFSQAIAETTRIEYDPDLPGRVVFEDGQLKQVPPFARPRTIRLPAPYPALPQYIIPHPEPVTLSQSLAAQGVRLVEARGTWPAPNMQLIRTLFDWGMLDNKPVRVGDQEVAILDAIFAHCLQSRAGQETQLYGYALHVDVVGTRDGQRVQHILTHTHPASDGSVPDWAGLRAYTRCVGIPMAIGAQLIAQGKALDVGAVPPERAFEPQLVFGELAKRDIQVHHEIRAPQED